MKSAESWKDCKGAAVQKNVTHAGSVVFYSFRNWESVELLQERCAFLMAWCSEDKACSSILDFLH